MKKVSSKTKLYQFLTERGLLINGSDEEILAAKREYRKAYLATYRKNYRNKKRHFAVILSEDELRIITQSAKKHGIKLPSFIKQAALGYLTNSFVIIEPFAVLELKHNILAIHNHIQTIAEKEQDRWYGLLNKYDVLKDSIQQIEKQVYVSLTQPKRLEELIKEQIAKDKNYLHALDKIIQDYADQKPWEKD